MDAVSRLIPDTLWGRNYGDERSILDTGVGTDSSRPSDPGIYVSTDVMNRSLHRYPMRINASRLKTKEGDFMPEKSDGAWYIISVAAIRAEVHEQTLRHYERLGLISPARKGESPRSPRLYSDRDIERVVQIRSLMRDLGVNLAGVETILHMKDRMEEMQSRLEQQMYEMQQQHESETRRLKDIIERLQRGS